jgi:hypothetical protein
MFQYEQYWMMLLPAVFITGLIATLISVSIYSPTPNRFRNAPSSAAGLSGNSIGSIIPTDAPPNARPATMPHSEADMRDEFDMMHLRPWSS